MTINLPQLFLSTVATIVVAAAVLFFIDLLAREIAVRREVKARELERRLAYPPRHYLNEDQDTVVLNVAAVDAALAEVAA